MSGKTKDCARDRLEEEEHKECVGGQAEEVVPVVVHSPEESGIEPDY